MKAGGSSSAFRIEGLGNVGHTVLAWKDTNGNGAMDRGDLAAAYRAVGGGLARVTPPATGLELTLEPVS